VRLDLTRPTLVIIGAWNPAIFQAGWCAEHLFDVPPGEQVRTAAVLTGMPPKEITYFDPVGIGVSTSRLELFANGIGDTPKDRVEATAIRILETLPHTPTGALGVNFFFVDNDPSDELIDSFNTADALRENYSINSRELSVGIDVEHATLNFTRALSKSVVSFNFNYHIENLSALGEHSEIRGIVQKYLSHALDLLQNVFSMPAEFEEIFHRFPDTQN
jgi:hypothetical protein